MSASNSSDNKSKLRIGIDAPFQGTGTEGGAEHVVLGLVSGLGQLTDGSEEYFILGPENASDWLKPYLGPNQQFVRWPKPGLTSKESLKRRLGKWRKPIGDLLRTTGILPKYDPLAVHPTPSSDGFCEKLRLDCIHFTYPLHFFLTQIPSLLTVHDLQHRHFPQFFVWNDLPWREQLYPTALKGSQNIAAISQFVGEDIQAQYHTPDSKLSVIPWAAPTECYEPINQVVLDNVRKKFDFDKPFVLYPSVTYEHKNHLRLIEAIAIAKQKYGTEIQLVCTGWKKLFWPEINKRLNELGCHDQVRFLGYVDSSELRAIYHLSQFVVFPSLFEGCGLALLEAFREEKAVAVSDISAFREYGKHAPLYFDPMNSDDIARKLIALWKDDSLRHESISRSSRIIEEYNWKTVALRYRALYRKTANVHLTETDKTLLSEVSLKMKNHDREISRDEVSL